MILLDATTKSLELVTSAATNVDYLVTYADNTTSAFTPGAADGQITTATTTTILSAPASSTQRTVKWINVLNTSTTISNSVKLQYDVSGTNRVLSPSFTLGPGESVRYTQEEGFKVSGDVGQDKSPGSGYIGKGQLLSAYCSVSSIEAHGWWLFCSASPTSSIPGQWGPGTPGVAGRATDGTDTANDSGCLYFTPASVGSLYVKAMFGASGGAITRRFDLWDVLWVNSGLSVTTTTAQTVNSVTFPARDLYGSSEGEGLKIALYITTQTGASGTITGSTVSYTNSQGVSGRTATLAGTVGSQFISSLNNRTIVFFYLQAGDTGVRSIESITLGTSLVSGGISLFVYRSIASTGLIRPVSNGGQTIGEKQLREIVHPKSCLLIAATADATNTDYTQVCVNLVEEY